MGSSARPPRELTLGARIKWVRNDRGEKAKDLAKAIGIGADRIGKLEGLKTMPRELSEVYLIATHYGIEADWLLEPSPKPERRLISLPRRRKADRQ